MNDQREQANQKQPARRYLHMASATESDVDAFIDALLADAAQDNQGRIDPGTVLRITLQSYGVDPSEVAHYWSQKASTGDREGLLAVVELKSGQCHAVINCPIFLLVQGARALQPEDLPQLLALAEQMPAGRVSARDGYVTYSETFPQAVLDEDQIPHIFRQLRNRLQAVKNTLMVAAARFFGADQTEIDRMILLPVLPDMTLSDEDAERIHYFLLKADQRARDLFVFLMERWAGLGYIVATTPQSIVLDAPYGEQGGRVRLAILLSGLSQNVADYFEGEGYEVTAPAVVLRWDSLRVQDGIPAEAFAAYQDAVGAALPLRLTSSSAHVQDVVDLDQVAMEKLLMAMDVLVRQIDHRAVKPRERSPRSTPSRVQASLDLCDPQTRAYYDRMVTGWNAADRTVQCTKIGRIYLKMHTRSHKTGNLARQARRFNLLTLVCPQEGQRPFIQIAWGLADEDHPAAYLDCIPDAVAEFEAKVAGLPGFEQQGTVTRVVLDDDFTDDHLETLLFGAYRLKSSEKSGR